MKKKLVSMATVALLALAMLACKEVNRQNSPVRLVVTTDQTLQRIDLEPNATNCNQNIGTVNVRSLLVQNTIGNTNLPIHSDLDDVKLTGYRVTYVRTDGGTQIPQPFTRSLSILITTGGGSQSTTFLAFTPDALTQAPFAALIPTNGGRDPQTGKTTVQMNITLEVFGETLAGERVSGFTTIPLDFCYHCQGCA